MILNKLYRFYGNAPAPLRKIIVICAGIARLGLRPFINKVRLGGYVEVLNPADNGALNCYAQGDNYEKAQVSLFLSYLSCNPCGIILDVGANYGQYSLAAANIGRYGAVEKIFAFEPDSGPFRCIQKSVVANHFESFFFPVQTIIGESKGVGEVLKSSSSSLSNRTFISGSKALTFKGRETCRIASIDEILAENNVQASDHHFLIKIDIEGNEPKAFRGAQKLLREAKGYLLQFEYYPFAMKEASENLAEFRTLLSNLSFDSALVLKDDDVLSIGKEELFTLLERLDADAQPLVAENFIILKNFQHPKAITQKLSQNLLSSSNKL